MVLRRVVPNVRYLSPSLFISDDEYARSVVIQKSSHTEQNTNLPIHLCIYGLAHTHAHTSSQSHAHYVVSRPLYPRGRVGLPCAGHDSSSTPTHPSNPHEIRRRRIARAAHSTSSREAIDRSIMLARTSVPTRTVATFERYARDDDECAVLADARREERGETRATRGG